MLAVCRADTEAALYIGINVVICHDLFDAATAGTMAMSNKLCMARGLPYEGCSACIFRIPANSFSVSMARALASRTLRK
jgi:hypothetical protein